MFLTTYTLYNDFHIRTIVEEACFFYLRFHTRLQNHPNPLININNLSIHTLLGNPTRRLKRKWCHDILPNFNAELIFNKKKKITNCNQLVKSYKRMAA